MGNGGNEFGRLQIGRVPAHRGSPTCGHLSRARRSRQANELVRVSCAKECEGSEIPTKLDRLHVAVLQCHDCDPQVLEGENINEKGQRDDPENSNLTFLQFLQASS